MERTVWLSLVSLCRPRSFSLVCSAQSINICSPFSMNLLTPTVNFFPILFGLVGLYLKKKILIAIQERFGREPPQIFMFIPLCPIRSLDHHLPRGSAGTSWAPFTVPGEEDRGRTDPRTYTCQRTSGCFSFPIASAAHLAFFFFLILRKIYFYFYFAMPRGISGLSSSIRD